MSNIAIVPISLPKELARELDRMAKKEAMTRSEYVRSLLRRQTAFWKLDELRKVASKRAEKAGIRTLQDAVRAVREIRNEKSRSRY